MSLQELLKERERINKELEKYEDEIQRIKELRYWQENFIAMRSMPLAHLVPRQNFVAIVLPSHIREIIVNALQAEIDKLKKE